ncbi:hypothetical protein [Couchioplanes azureus]|uniref:hypothetical protein n=1 Tax=Couchioplanes caeruleus TaxID=56438 RepID=UPI001E4776B7|nr:hypothetical protein [Couchioplanes caeruleus]
MSAQAGVDAVEGVFAGAGEGEGEEAAGVDVVDDVEDDSDLLSDDEVEDVVDLSELPLPERESLR